MKTEPRLPARAGLVPIPRPPAKPVVGHMLDLDPNAPIQSLMGLARKMGPIFELEVMGKSFTVVSGFEIVAELSDEKRFDKSVRGPLGRIRQMAGDGLFTAYTSEPNWSKAHNILLPNFGDRAMQSYHPTMLDVAAEMCEKWARLNAGDEIDVVHDMTALTLDTIGLCGFGYRFNSFYREGNHPFVNAMVESLEIVMSERGYPYENVVRKDRVRKLEANIELMNRLVDPIIAERKAERAALGPGAPKRDLLDYMLDGVDRKSGERLDDVNIRYQIITFLIAGHETTSGMLSFTMYYLLKNPDVLAKAYAEVDRVFGTDTSVRPTMKQVNGLTYITQILKESLRMWPTAPAFSLLPNKDEIVGGRYLLKKRSQVTLLLTMLHRDPAVWGERAEHFDPENFSKEAEAARPQSAYKPFGNGQRACIGRQFAMQESALVFGMILQRFELVDDVRYQLRVRETLTIKPEGLKIGMRPRVRGLSARPAPAVAHTNGAATATVEPPAPSTPKHGTPLLVLFGSNLGTSEDMARHVAETGSAQGYEVTLGRLDDYAGNLPAAGAVAIVTASYNGAPPDNAAGFCRWLQDGMPLGALAGVKYTVFGAGNRNWDSTYQAVPRFIDRKLAEFGAERLYDRGEGDARDDLDAHFQTWKTPLWPALASALGIAYTESPALADRPMYRVEFVPGPQPNPLAAAHGARGMFVTENRELQNGGERSTRHIEVGLPEGVTYRTGDHLGVLASNGQAIVDRVLRRFGLDATTHVRLQSTGPGRIASLPLDATLSVRRLVMHYVEVQHAATRKQIVTLAEHTQCPNSKRALLALASGDDDARVWRDEIKAKRTSILDLLERFPACDLPLQTFLEMLPLMTPRFYSISSSPLASPAHASVTVGVVREPAWSGNGVYEGVASTHLARREAGTRLFAFVKESKSGFTLPEDPATPIVMVGPGTGLAPFRGFLHERAALRARGATLGPAMLFFGCRRPDRDYLYRSELEAFASDRIVDLNVAFSRVGEKKTYVQDLIGERAGDVWALLAAGAHVYVCGDGSRMEPQVRARFEALYRAKTDEDDAASAAWMADLVERRRYVLDVWAST